MSRNLSYAKASPATSSGPQSRDLAQNLNPNDPTAQGNLAANNLGRLRKLAKEINQKALEKKLFLVLRSMGVGTTKIEAQALKLVEEGKSKAARMAKQDKANGFKIVDRIRNY